MGLGDRDHRSDRGHYLHCGVYTEDIDVFITACGYDMTRDSSHTTDEPRDDFAAILDLLRDVQTELRAHAAILAGIRELLTRSLSGKDRRILNKLLSMIHGHWGSNEFTTAELLEYPIARALLGELNSKKVGRILLRASKQPHIGKYRLERIGDDHNSALWKLVR